MTNSKQACERMESSPVTTEKRTAGYRRFFSCYGGSVSCNATWTSAGTSETKQRRKRY